MPKNVRVDVGPSSLSSATGMPRLQHKASIARTELVWALDSMVVLQNPHDCFGEVIEEVGG